MSITIAGGITFGGGGFTLTVAPPSTATAGWFGGGYTPSTVSTVSRITFATDTTTASNRGPLSIARYSLGGAGNLTDGWFGGGYVTSSRVDRITYATDTATTTVRGPLNQAIYSLSATGTSDYGWFTGGYIPTTPSASAPRSSVSRITYASDSSTASARGPLTLARYGVSDVTDSTTYGWISGGFGTAIVSIIDRIVYATDTVAATARGNLAVPVNAAGSSNTTTYGWFAGGLQSVGPAPANSSYVQRITFATDTAVASTRGPIFTGRSMGGVGDNTYGWFGGSSAPWVSTVQRITYATDTDAASARGPLYAPQAGAGATSGVQ